MRDTILAFACGLAILFGVSALYLPSSPGREPPPVSAPYCLDLPIQPVALDLIKKKTCSPECKAPTVCVDGTCCLPAVQHAPGSCNAFAWVEESLR